MADRTYLREEHHPTRYTTILIVVLIGAFILQSILLVYGGLNAYRWLGLSVSGLQHWRLWQFLTYQFLHSAPWPWHVLFNCLGLYFFGRPVEETLGSRRFLSLYFLAGFAGGLLQVLATIALPHHPDIPMVGASAGVCGLIAIFCALHPMRELTAWIYFFPVTLRARTLLWFLTGLSVFGTLIPFDTVAHGAHLGGILLGLGYVRWFHDSDRLGLFWARFRRPRRPRPVVKVRFPKTVPGLDSPKPLRAEELGPTDFISKEVDPILEKISAHGIHSLTEREREILEAARAKMDRH